MPPPTLAHETVRAVLVAALVAALVALAGCGAAKHDRSRSSEPASRNVAAPLLSSQSSSATPPTVAPTATNPSARTVTVLGSGDVLIHPPLWQQAAADAKAAHETGYDFGSIYSSIAPDTSSADLATCELETPLAPPGGPFAGWPNFNAPPQVLTALKKIGYDSCTTASNHSLDQGFSGVKRTLDEVDQAGLQHTGSARSAAEAARPLIITTAAGVKVAQLAYAFGFNGIPLPAGEPWLANLTDIPTILAAARRAKQAGADIVVLSMHWGTEYQHEPTAEQTNQAKQLLDSPDIDVILGDHTHVVEPFARVGAKWVAYGMGNQISRHADPINDNREGVMPRFTFTEITPHHWRITKAEAIPTWMELSPQLRLIDLPRALSDPAITAGQRATYQAAFNRIEHYVGTLGALRDGLTVARK
jgi:sugar phosphate isomerase/epimerase